MKLKEVRLSRDLSRSDLAEKAGCTERTIQAIELGERVPSLGLAVKLAEALTCKIEEII